MRLNNMEKVKVIILYNRLFHYRIPVWNILASKCDLTVAYSEGDGNVPDGIHCDFTILYLPAKVLKNRMVIQRDNIRKLVKGYDVIIAYGDIAWLKYSTLPWFSNNKVIFHTIGVSASYEKGYDQHKGWDNIRYFFYKRATALAFYTDYPIKKYVEMGVPREKLFVAPNTVAVSPIDGEMKKDSILVIGTLYREKGLQLLLDAYAELKDKCKLPMLNIVGKGPDYDLIKQWIEENKMQDVIFLRGAIFDIGEKAKYFAKALACISPKQAGLTVLESMGYGVPFITTKNAITGGELLNVHNGIDGVVLENESLLTATIRDISDNPDKYVLMGKEAKKYYDECRSPKHMAEGLWDAIQYAYNH